MEVILATAVFTALVAGIALTVGNSTIKFAGPEDNTTKERFASEALEAVKAIRDKSWLAISGTPTSTAYDVRKNSSGDWELYNGTSSRGSFRRNIYFYDVNRESTGSIADAGGTWDPTTKKVIVKIEGGTANYQIQNYLGSWQAYTINQTDWSGTAGQETWVSNSLSDDIYSSSTTGIESGTVGELTLDSDWYSRYWGYRKKVTIDNTKVSGASDFTNFPILFSLLDSDFKSVAHGGKVGTTNGDDIVFTSTDGQTLLDYELEEYNSTTGAVNVWVEVPTLTTASDTVIYVYFGNGSAANQEDPTGVWDANYKVWHLDETTGTTYDSTSNNKDAVNTNSTLDATGWIGNGNSFDGDTDYLTAAQVMTTDNTMTYGGWFQATDHSVGQVRAVLQQTDASENGFEMFTMKNLTKAKVFCWDGVGNSPSGYTLELNTWYLVYCLHDGTDMKLFVNGTQRDTISSAVTADAASFQMGGGVEQGTYWHNGPLDEVRVSNVARSADYLLTEYNNESSTSTFYTIGSLTMQSGGGWYSSDWGYRKKITIDADQVSGSSDLSGFPVLISDTSADWKSTGNGGHVGQTDGGDLVFTSADGVSKLYHEIESYTATTGQLIAWVKIPTLDYDNDTEIYLYYGNASVANQWSITDTWDSSFTAVWHLSEDPTTSTDCNGGAGSKEFCDSTSNNNDGDKP